MHCWVTIYCLLVIWKQIKSLAFIQLTSKQSIITQQFTARDDLFLKQGLVFIKHYAPNSLRLTVNSHHVLFVKMLAKFSKGHNSSKIKMIFFF